MKANGKKKSLYEKSTRKKNGSKKLLEQHFVMVSVDARLGTDSMGKKFSRNCPD